MTTDRLEGSETFVLDPGPILCKCGDVATHLLEIHWVDMCTPERPTLANFMCELCFDISLDRAERIVLDGAEWCSSCGLTIDRLSAIIVSQCQLEG
jgi:hypothetical protein